LTTTPIDANRVAVATKRFSTLDFWRELLIASRFGLVGIVATAVHIAVVWLLLRETGIAPIFANTLAFLMAFGISFAGNYLWTFRSPGNPRRAMFRFFVIAFTAFAANTLVLSFLLHKGWFLPDVSAIFSASAVPVISFLASRLWGFK
jgi:putative flippase GtrA